MNRYFEQVFPVSSTGSDLKKGQVPSCFEVCYFPCLTDNYGFLVHDRGCGETVCIDTPDADIILSVAAEKNWKISQIWNTHHHWDHTQGNQKIRQKTGARLIAPKKEKDRIPGADQYVEEGDCVFLGTESVQILSVPGHTLGHIAYIFSRQAFGFVGDCLFVLGCGRLFEGSATQMWQSLEKLSAFSDEYIFYCAHEYSESNARFALSVDPENQALQKKSFEISQHRKKGLPTIPVQLGEERQTNPFLRANQPTLVKRLNMESSSPDAVFAALRTAKDHFRE